MRVKYKCRCMAADVEIDVPDRLLGADIQGWVENAARNIGYDHSQRSPHCRSRTMDYVMIPLPEGSDQIGSPPSA